MDAGTVDLLRSLKKKVVSSANLIQRFEAVWSAEQHAGHIEAGKRIDKITQEAFAHAAKLVRSKTAFTEYGLQQWMAEQFRANGLTADSAPIVAVGPHSGDPHYEPKKEGSSQIKEGDLLLLDVWGKLDKPDSVYYDITWMGFVGSAPSYKTAPQTANTDVADSDGGDADDTDDGSASCPLPTDTVVVL